MLQTNLNDQPAKLHALCAKTVLTCQRTLPAHVPTCLAWLRAHVSWVLMWQRALRANVLMCQRVFCAYVFTCKRALHAYVLTCFACSHPHVSTCLACLYTHLSNMPWVPCPPQLAWPRDHLSTCFAASISSFDATFSSFIAIAVDVVHTVGKV